MRILQPADWSKPRGFSHGVALDGPGRWIVLAGQTGGDEKGDEWAPRKDVQCLHRIHAGGAGFNGTFQIVVRTPNGKADLPQIASELRMEIDDLFPVAETLQMMRFAEVAGDR